MLAQCTKLMLACLAQYRMLPSSLPIFLARSVGTLGIARKKGRVVKMGGASVLVIARYPTAPSGGKLKLKIISVNDGAVPYLPVTSSQLPLGSDDHVSPTRRGLIVTSGGAGFSVVSHFLGTVTVPPANIYRQRF